MSIASYSIWLSIINIFGLAISALNQLIIADKIGVTSQMDVYYGSISIPTIVRIFFASSFGHVIIPKYFDLTTRYSPEYARSYMSKSIRLLMFGMVTTGGITCLFSSIVMKSLCPGFSTSQIELSKVIFCIEMCVNILVGISILLTASHHVNHSFIKPAIAVILPTLFGAIGVYMVDSSIALYGLVAGEIIGAIVAIAVVGVQKIGIMNLFNKEEITYKDIIPIMLIMAPIVILSFLQNSNVIIERYFASHVGLGAISYLGYGSRLATIVTMIMTSGIVTVMYPKMSAQIYSNEGMRHDYITDQIRVILLLSVPALIILSLEGNFFVRMLFERGSFTADDTRNLSRLIPYYMISAGLMSVGHVVGRGLYAKLVTIQPLFCGILSLVVYVTSCVILVKRFGYVGLALATAIYWFVLISLLYKTLIMLYRTKTAVIFKTMAFILLINSPIIFIYLIMQSQCNNNRFLAVLLMTVIACVISYRKAINIIVKYNS